MGKRKRMFSLAGIVCLVMVVGLIGTLAGTSKAEEEPIKLIIATWEPPKATMAQPLRDWLKELEERSGGRVTGEISYAAMGPPPKYYDLAVEGIAHATIIGVPYTPGRFPMSDVVNLPITGDVSNEVFAKAYWALYEKGYFDKEFKDVKVLWLAGFCPYSLHMIKGQDVRTLADIKGKKIRVSGAIHTEIVKALGGVPVGMAAPEIPIAMQKGTLDGLFMGWSFIKAFRTEKVTASVTLLDASGFMSGMVMNKKKYESLPDDIKKIIDDMGPKYSAVVGRAFDKDDVDAMNMLKDAGGVIHEFSPKDMEEIGKRLAPLWNNWIDEMEAKGHPGKAIVADYYKILKSMGSKRPFHGYVP